MAVPVLESTAVATTTGTSIVGTEPTGSSEDDLIVAVLVTDSSENHTGAPDGTWTLLLDEFDFSGGTSPTISVWYQVRGASAPDYDAFTWASTETAVLRTFRFSSIDTTTPIDVTPVGTASSAGSDTDCPTGSVTTSNDETLILRLNAVDFHTALDSGATNNGFPAGHTQGVDTSSPTPGSCGLAYAYETGPDPAGGTGSDTWVRDANRLQHGVTIAIRGSSAGPTIIADAVPNGTLSLTGVTPAEFQLHNKDVPAGALSLTGVAPQDFQLHNDAVPAGQLTLTGIAPADATLERIADAVPAGQLTLTGIAPAEFQLHNKDVPAGLLTLTGVVPGDNEVLTGITVISEPVPLGSLTLTGVVPGEFQQHIDAVPRGTLTLTGFAPGEAQRGVIAEAVPPGFLTLTGFAPGEFNSGLAVVEKPTAGGGPVRDTRRRKRRVQIGEHIYWVSSVAELRMLLDRYIREQRAKLATEQQKPQTPTRRKTIRVIQNRVRRAEKRAEPVMRDYLAELDDEILTMYIAGQL